MQGFVSLRVAQTKVEILRNVNVLQKETHLTHLAHQRKPFVFLEVYNRHASKPGMLERNGIFIVGQIYIYRSKCIHKNANGVTISVYGNKYRHQYLIKELHAALWFIRAIVGSVC